MSKVLDTFLNKTLVILWDRFKVKNAKIASTIVVVVAFLLVLLNAILSSVEVNVLLSPVIIQYITWTINALGFIRIAITAPRTTSDLEAIKNELNNDIKSNEQSA